MNGSRSTSQRLGERSSLDALSRTIEGLEARIEGLVGGQRPRQPERDPREVRPDPLAEIRERQRMLEESRNRALSGAARPPIPQPQQRDEFRREPERRAPEPYRARETRSPASAGETDLREIAQALVSLREELKRDISEGVAREVNALRTEMHDIKTVATDRRGSTDDLRAELARLGESIDLLGHQTRARGGSDALRAEFEDLRALMDGLAREESVQVMEKRWRGMERRLEEFDPQPMREEIVSLAYRLDDIKGQLGALNPSPAIRALEDRLLAVAEALEQIGRQMKPNDHLIAEQFAGLDLRLDEISRAIAAGARNAAAQEPEHFGRLERRLAGLAEQIEMMGEENRHRPNPADDLARRIEGLAARVEELAAADAGAEAASRLEERLDQLSRLLERNQKAPPAPELTGFLSDISRKIDALDNGSVNDRLTERLEYLARRIDELEYAPVTAPQQDDAAIGRLESRLADIARRLDETASTPPQDNRALESLESQIANLAALINRPAPVAAAALPAEFESRMASIEEYMATSDEYIIEAARQAAEAVMEAYGRNAGSAPNQVDLSALSALAGDLRHLEELAHSSEERTHRTFEALHDTLVQIATRLDDLDHRLYETREQQPAAEERAFGRRGPLAMADAQPAPYQEARQPAAAFAGDEDEAFDPFADSDPVSAFSGPVIRTVEPEVAEAVEETAREFVAPRPAEPVEPKVTKGFLAGLKSKLLRKGPAPAAPRKAAGPTERAVVDPAPPIVPEDEALASVETELLEPGSGAPDIKKILERVRAGQSRPGSIPTEADRADLIAAARRAAQAAAQEAKASAKPVKETASARLKPPVSPSGSVFSRHRRPILMAVGAVLLVIMTMPLVSTFLNGSDAPEVVETADVEQAAPIAPPATPKPAAKAEAPKTEAAKPAKPAPKPAAEAAAKPAAPKPAESPKAPKPVSQAAPAATPVAAAAVPAAAADPARLTNTAPVAGAQAAQPLSTAPAPQAAAMAAPAAPAIALPANLEPKALADAASAGDPLALFEIGARFTEGRGVKADLAEAARWYQLAADKGFAPAEYRIANLYEKGNGVERDLSKAVRYYERAAKAGNASAMHNLAVLYATGADGKPDIAKAVDWFKQAADYGVSDSQFNLAILYARGNGIAQDLEESYKWFAIAAKGGDKDAAQKRDDVANAMRPDQLTNAKAKVELWKAKPVDPKVNQTDIPDEWAGKGLKTASVDMKKAIRNIQAILNNNGFDAGKPDGELGARTISAIKAFQKSVGMPEDGKITDRLVKELLARNK
ncbi:peptidoglycan-binding protein [Gellertiella hungarica]|uniref:Localization factor PodJL n=1 Tax=Gellertiella hungarica TaxID=1572859 RepID=A0A7W6NK51_9HYPH|nr:peptidoglycan-binding protein [Gellertiella hungarica]MBB4063922.1 localization factor PodJL [Gellertiella hungarica]